MRAPYGESISAAGLEYAERFCNGTISVWKMQVAERAHNMIE
jgi:hypothetical protein